MLEDKTLSSVYASPREPGNSATSSRCIKSTWTKVPDNCKFPHRSIAHSTFSIAGEACYTLVYTASLFYFSPSGDLVSLSKRYDLSPALLFAPHCSRPSNHIFMRSEHLRSMTATPRSPISPSRCSRSASTSYPRAPRRVPSHSLYLPHWDR